MKYLLMLILIVVTVGCAPSAVTHTDAQIASHNLSKAADMFEINRRLVFYNSHLGTYMLVIEGRISIAVDGRERQLEVTCKTGQNQYKKHFLGLSRDVTYFLEQLESKEVSAYHYKVIFKPEAIILDIDLKTKSNSKTK